MNKQEMIDRTKRFALSVIKVTETLPRTRTADVIGRQLVRCGTSVGANYRSACRARSRADFVAKLGIVEEEADETLYWMELLIESGLMKRDSLSVLLKEANELSAIIVATIRATRAGKLTNPKSDIRNPKLVRQKETEGVK